MSTKSKVLELLEAKKGAVVSGAEAAAMLGISRSAVWKAVNSLKKDGYSINAAPNSGYYLSDDSDIISREAIAALGAADFSCDIKVFDELVSTNTYAKELAVKGARHGTVIIARTQTAGRGRFGREFYSPPDSGLYMSIVLDPEKTIKDNPALITAYAAVVVCRAIKEVYDADAAIKWVNDIFLNGKKVCGILTEAASDFESGRLQWIVLGIGVNINDADFPPEIKDVAGSLLSSEGKGRKNRFAAELIKNIMADAKKSGVKEIIAEYKERLFILDKEITVHKDPPYKARALDIDEDAALIVKREDGAVEKLFSGEVSIKI